MASAESSEAARIRELEAQLARLGAERDTLASQIARIGSERDTLASQVVSLAKKVEALEFDRDRLLKRFFGQKAEKFDPPSFVWSSPMSRKPRRRSGRLTSTKLLTWRARRRTSARRRRSARARTDAAGCRRRSPRVRREHHLEEKQLPCPDCGDPRRPIGAETTEVLEYTPALFKVIEHVRTNTPAQAARAMWCARRCPKAKGRSSTAAGLGPVSSRTW